MRRRCTSPRTMMWSKHSRRIDPISRSATPFCQGEAGAIGLSRMPMARNRRVRRVVMQEGPPSLARRPPPFDHVLGDAGLRDLKPELEQFAVDAWRTPKRILDAHPPDQRAQLCVDPRPP